MNKLKISFNLTYSLFLLITITTAFVHADSPLLISIYNSELPPGPGVAKLPDPPQVITIYPGTPYLLAAKVFDRNGVWLSQYQLSGLRDSITWRASDRFGSITTMFDTQKGAVCHFTPTKAYDTVTIVATFRPDSLTTLTDTVRFRVFVCCPVLRLVIEPKGPINLNSANPLDTLIIQADEPFKSVYAIFRDPFGNFVSYGKIAHWVSLDTSIVKVQKGDSLFGEGIVTRNPAALASITKIYAVDTSGASDTCVVKLAACCPYFKIRIVVGNDTNPVSLVMNTNQDTTLSVQEWRSDNPVWVDISAAWQSSSNLKIDPPAPTSHSWRFSPADTGFGWICVTLGTYTPDTLPVHFTGGPSVRNHALFEIITPPDSIIAGKPILAVVRIYDKNGKGYSYTFDTTAGSKVAYHDALGNGGVMFPEPFIIVDGDTLLLDSSPWSSGNQTFVNGVDTVSFTLYNAPLDTNQKHQLYVNFIIGTDTIHAATRPFVFYPDNIMNYTKVRLEYPDGTPVPDTLNLINPVTLILRGYDQWGNRVGEILGTWSVTGSLHPIAGQTTGSSIIYNPSIIKGTSESGYIIVDHNGIKDSVYVIICPQNIRNGTGRFQPDKWKIAASNGSVSIHIPLHGAHLINVYSLSGSNIYSSRTIANDAQIKLPKGVFILSVQTIGCAERFSEKIFNH